MPKPTIVDFSTLFNANIIQPLCDLAWDVFGSDAEDRPVNTVAEAREKLGAVSQTDFDSRINDLYPVGSLYFCTAAVNPNSALPGTWALLTEGQFLVSAGGTGDYALGATGGEEEVTLTDAQMPSHTHNPTDTTNYRHLWSGTGPAAGGDILGLGSDIRVVTQTESGVVLDTQGSDQPHENRPPYLAVNMWQRTA